MVFFYLIFEYFFFECQCCLEGGSGNLGCGYGKSPLCTAYGTNLAGTGNGTCAIRSGSNYDSFVKIFFQN